MNIPQQIKVNSNDATKLRKLLIYRLQMLVHSQANLCSYSTFLGHQVARSSAGHQGLENVREVAKFKDTCVCQPEVIMSLSDLTVSSSVLSSWAAKCDIDRLLSRWS